MFCALSGEAPSEPVVSKLTGHVFEKRLIEKYVLDQGKDPITGQEMSMEDVVGLTMANKFVKPRPPTVNSIPTLLSLFQNEWDALVLESFQLKQQYHQTRQELSNALYENDAAKRVIARLVKERDEARAQLDQVKATYSAPAAATNGSAAAHPAQEETAMDLDTQKMPAHVVQDLDDTAASQRKAPTSLASIEEIQQYQAIAKSQTSHSNAGIASLDVLSNVDVLGAPRNWVVLGGKDGKVTVRSFDAESGETEQIATVKAHTKTVSAVTWSGTYSVPAGIQEGLFFSGGIDKTIKAWGCDESSQGKLSFKERFAIKEHKGEIKGLSMQASGKYLGSCDTESVWCLSDAATGQVLSKNEGQVHGGYSAMHFHPDGLILGLGGADSAVRIWDVKSMSCVQTFTGHSHAISSVCFSENGYYLATSAFQENVVKLWDLRKLTNFHTIELDQVKGDAGVQKVQFDVTGSYLAAAVGDEIRLFLNKQFNALSSVRVTDSSVNGLGWGQDARLCFSIGAESALVTCGIRQ